MRRRTIALRTFEQNCPHRGVFEPFNDDDSSTSQLLLAASHADLPAANGMAGQPQHPLSYTKSPLQNINSICKNSRKRGQGVGTLVGTEQLISDKCCVARVDPPRVFVTSTLPLSTQINGITLVYIQPPHCRQMPRYGDMNKRQKSIANVTSIISKGPEK